MSAQKPMAVRMQEMLARLQQYGGTRVDALDKKVLKRLIKAGSAKITNGNGRAPIVNGRKWVMANHSMAVPTTMPPLPELTTTGGPYAKRRAAMEASGEDYRGKTWGKVRVDLPRDAREKKIKERDIMWKKLKDWRT